ncbi:hypothetical protein FRB90_000101 [Tulasnella sp. 427]|nr:hypothetical protein FRB90_000101 [Tulasnella sp. 427]
MSYLPAPSNLVASSSSKYNYDSSSSGTVGQSNHHPHSLILRRGSPSQGQQIMHPALLISEIIHGIFSNFVIPADRATLINLACTCQAFHDIALDYLWKEIRGVTPFSRMLFPEPLNDEVDNDGAWRSRTERFQVVRTEREVNNNPIFLLFIARMIALGLDEKRRSRVMTCARRVRRIAMGDKDMDDPETYTFFAFVAAYPPQPDPAYPDSNLSVLPNLRHLHCTVRSIHGITHTIHLLQLTSNKLWDRNGSHSGSSSSSQVPTMSSTIATTTTANIGTAPELQSGARRPRPPLPTRSSTGSHHTSSLRTLQISAFVPWTYQTSSQILVNERYMELARAGATLTRLERLEFRVDQVSSAIEIAFANAVANLTSIRYIDLGLKKHAIGRAIAHMAGKTELRDVRLNFSKEDVPGALEPHPSGTFESLFAEAELLPVTTFADAQAYPVLETLHLSASADCVVDTLRFFDLPSALRNLQIHPTALSLDDLTFLVEVMSTNPTQLQTCVISDTRLWMNKRTLGNVAPFTMRPLYPMLILSRLEVLKIDLDVVYHLTDEDLSDMASAWPELQVLHICPWKEVEVVSATSLPSFVGLKTLTTGCPKLGELKLKIDASRNVGEVIKSLGKSSRARSAELRKWFIGASAIEDGQAEVVAEAIHLLFPKLEALGLPREVVGNPAKYEEWTKVHDALRTLQPIREDPYLRM